MNKVILCGRLTTNPIVNVYSNGETKVARFTLAIDRRRKGADGQSNADFLRVSCFGKEADFAEQYINQGDTVSVIGRIQTGSYNGKDGKKVYTTDIVSENLELIYKHNKPKEDTVTPEPASNSSARNTIMVPSDFMEANDDEDDLPFN